MTVARVQPAERNPQAGTDRTPPHERILSVARRLFCRNGIHATGIDRILSEAGASKMTLYSRFGSKEALLREVLTREGQAQRGAIYAAIEAAGPDPKQGLLSVIEGVRSLFQGDEFYGCAFMNAAAEHTKGAAAEPWLRDAAKSHTGELADRLESLAAAAGYDDPPTLARQVLLIMDGAIAGLMATGDTAVLGIAERNLRAVLA